MRLFRPWKSSSHGSRKDYADQVDYLALFISQTARSLAFMGQFDAKSYHGYTITGRSVHLRMLCTALRILALLPQSIRGFLPPENVTTSQRAYHASSSPFAPSRRYEVLREWRFIQSDVAYGLGICGYCRRSCDKDQRLRVCTVCSANVCNQCYSTIATRAIRKQYLETLRILLRLERDVSSVLDSLEDIASRSSEVLRKVFSQNDVLECWIHSRKDAYQNCGKQQCKGIGFQVYSSQFRMTDFVGWNAIDAMARCLSLQVVKHQDPDIVGPDGKDAEDPWIEVTRLWQHIYAFERPGEEFRSPCTHRRFLELTPDDVCSIDGHLIHDSSGHVSFEVFEALAKKYEDSGKSGNSKMEDLQSTPVSDWLFGGQRTETGPNSLLMIPESLRDDGENGDESSSLRGVSMGSSGSSGSGSISAAASESGSEPVSEPGSESGSTHEEEFKDLMRSKGISDDWIEDLLDNLLEKFKSLGREASGREETELVLETAWKMGQAIVYRDTPRPSLKEISEQNVGFYTAPTSPATSSFSHGGSDRSLTMYTARSVSPISWFLEDDSELEEG